jgi:D-2-hydroxyacid dehydrogenase (NADP+)
MPLVIDPGAGHLDPETLRSRLPSADVRAPEREAVAEAVRAADGPVVFTCSNSAWRPEYLDALSAGDWVLTTTAGYDSYPVEAFAERGVELTNSPGISAGTVAEHALGLITTFTRRLDHYREKQRAGEWGERRDDLFDLVDTEACVVGLGTVGEQVARRLDACGARVRGVKRDPDDYAGVVHERRVFGSEGLQGALDGVRVVVLAVPLTAETRGLLGGAELTALADDAVVINVARGPVLDTDALLDALDAGGLRGAGIDVFDEEPLPADSPLWDREDVLITPHCAGTTERYGERATEVVVRQYERWAAGEARENRVV